MPKKLVKKKINCFLPNTPKTPKTLFESPICSVTSPVFIISGTQTEGTQPGFLFPNSGDPLGTPTNLKKKHFISFKPFLKVNMRSEPIYIVTFSIKIL